MKKRGMKAIIAFGALSWIILLLRSSHQPQWDDWRNEQLVKAVQNGNVSSAYVWLEMGADANLTVYVDEHLSVFSPEIDPEISIHFVATLPATPLLCFTTQADHSGSRSLLVRALLVRALLVRALLVRALLNHGADPNASIKGGYMGCSHPGNALQGAVESDDETTARVLLAYGATIDSEKVFASVSRGNDEMLRLLLNGSSGSLTDFRGATLLQRAAEKGNLSAMRLLIGRGAVIDERDSVGKTALMFAARKGQSNAATLLLDYGANPNAQDAQGMTALHWAADTEAYSSIYGGDSDGPKPGFPVVSLLQKRGARLDVKNKQGRTPADLIVFDMRRGWMR